MTKSWSCCRLYGETYISSVVSFAKKEGHYTLDTDSSDGQIWCVLPQKQDYNFDRPVSYSLNVLKSCESNLDTIHRECLAVVWSILLLRQFLEGTRFTVRAYHRALKWILSMADATEKLARSRLRLLEYDFKVIYRAGVRHQAADVISRVRTEGKDYLDIETDIPVKAVAAHARSRQIRLV